MHVVHENTTFLTRLVYIFWYASCQRNTLFSGVSGASGTGISEACGAIPGLNGGVVRYLWKSGGDRSEGGGEESHGNAPGIDEEGSGGIGVPVEAVKCRRTQGKGLYRRIVK